MNNIEQNFIWWVGVVEDRNDPLQIGRCRVRILGYHTDNKQDMPTDELPWAYPAMPINTPSRTTPVGPVEGTWIMGFFRDGNSAQQPVMTNIINYGYVNPDNPRVGFNDPDPNAAGRPKRPDGEDWPNVGDINTHKLSRGEKSSTWIDSNDPVDPVSTAITNKNWDEPSSKYNSKYPYNTVNESESGHVTEIDDTPGAERLVRRHRTGTFEEIYPDGSRVVKVVKKDYEMVLSEKNLHISKKGQGDTGDFNITVDGDLNIKVGGTLRFDVKNQVRVKTKQPGPAGAIVLQAGIEKDIGALGTAPILVNGVALGTNTGMPIMHGAGAPMVVPAPLPVVTAPDMSAGIPEKNVRQVMKQLGSTAAAKPIGLDPQQFDILVTESEMAKLKEPKFTEKGEIIVPELTDADIAAAELYDPETQTIWERAPVSDVIKPSKAGTKYKIASLGVIPDEKWKELGAKSTKIGSEFTYNGTPLDHTFYPTGGIGTVSITRGKPEVWKQAVQMPIPSIPPPATLPWKDRMKQHFDEATGKVVFDIHIGDLLRISSRGMLLSVLKPIFDEINSAAQYTLEEVLHFLTPTDLDKLIERLSLGTAANGIASLEKLITEVNNKVNEYKQYQEVLKHGISLNIKITVQAGKLALKALHNKGEISPTPTRVKNYSNHFYQMLTGKIEPSEELKSLLEE